MPLTSSSKDGAGPARPVLVLFRATLVTVALLSTPALGQNPWRDVLRAHELAFSEVGDAAQRRASIEALRGHDRPEAVALYWKAMAWLEDWLEPQRITYGDVLRRLEPLAKDLLYPEERDELDSLRKKRDELATIITDGEGTQDVIIEILAATGEEQVLDKVALTGLRHEHWKVRWAAAEVIARAGYTSALSKVIPLLRDEDARVRTAAVEALGSFRAREAEASLIRCLEKDEAWQVRAAAVDAVADLGTPDCVQALIAALGREEGRLLGDICSKLRLLTGQKLLAKYDVWRDWWEKAKDDFKGATILRRAPLPPIMMRRDPSLPPISYSGIETTSDRVVFVLDISDSMNDRAASQTLLDGRVGERDAPGRSKMESARNELKAAIRSLTSKDYFNIIVYNHNVRKWQDKMVPANPSNITLALRFLDGLMAEGGTNIFDALEAAFGLGGFGAYDKYYRSSVDTIFLLSDGAPSHGRIIDPDRIRAEILRMNKLQKIRIHTVSIGQLADGDFLEALAKDNGGDHIKRL
jgi:hypothetical protein